MAQLTDQEIATNRETMRHIYMVRRLLYQFQEEIDSRAAQHDQSKLEEPERSIFTIYTPLLRTSRYGSPEYDQHKREMKVALDHHYAHNRHHPEYFVNGIDGMNLIDIIEMLVDWSAAVLRHDDGDIWESLEINRKRFALSDQLTCILSNTISYMRLDQRSYVQS